MEVLRAADFRRMPWKNGGGETVEVAVFPQGSTVDTFDWRISMATVAADGPFSMFPGIDRTLSILDGHGMELSIEGREAVLLTQTSSPHGFPADSATTARLPAGAITDLNVMTRRTRFCHRVTRMAAGDIAPSSCDATVTAIIVTGAAHVEGQKLGSLDAVVLGDGDRQAVIGRTETPFFIIELIACA